MGLMFEPLGKFVRLIDERNKNLISESVLGINIDKFFMPSVANVIGTDLENYKVLRKGRFACNPMHVGRDGRLPVSLYTEDLPAIVSPAYFLFEVVDETVIEPEYLMLCFRHPNFDRMCWFRTDASVRGGITWEDVCALNIPVPPIQQQKEMVKNYNAVVNRIDLLNRIDKNIKDQMACVFQELFESEESASWEKRKLGDFLSLERGLSYKGEYLAETGTPMINLGNILPNSTYRSEKIKYYQGDYAERHIVKPGDVLMANTDLTPALEVIGSAILVPDFYNQTVICSHHVSIVRNCKISKYYILGLFNRPAFRERVKGFATGTTVSAIPTETVLNFEVNVPPKSIIDKYEKIVLPMYAYKDIVQQEINCLMSLKGKVMERVSNG